MNIDRYVTKSLELHLFFGRIMKEHALFLRAGFTPANAAFSQKAEFFKKEFEKLLSQAITLSCGCVGRAVLESGELVTEFTQSAERQTECLTGISIDKDLTAREFQLLRGRCRNVAGKRAEVQRLNQRSLELLDGLIAFKEELLRCVRRCEVFTANYPLLLEHILREAKLYRDFVRKLESTGDLSCASMKEVECFWNQIMMEHALFIRGLLDPSETELFCAADGFAKEFAELLENCKNAQCRTMTGASIEKTTRLRDFKKAGAQGIRDCKIRSMILPLLADHVLREANHYLRLLRG